MLTPPSRRARASIGHVSVGPDLRGAPFVMLNDRPSERFTDLSNRDKPTSNRIRRWEKVTKHAEASRLEPKAGQKAYRATVYVTIFARDKREARRRLQTVRGGGVDVLVDSTEGPEEVDAQAKPPRT